LEIGGSQLELVSFGFQKDIGKDGKGVFCCDRRLDCLDALQKLAFGANDLHVLFIIPSSYVLSYCIKLAVVVVVGLNFVKDYYGFTEML
jgi:hypothetical protein